MQFSVAAIPLINDTLRHKSSSSHYSFQYLIHRWRRELKYFQKCTVSQTLLYTLVRRVEILSSFQMELYRPCLWSAEQIADIKQSLNLGPADAQFVTSSQTHAPFQSLVSSLDYSESSCWNFSGKYFLAKLFAKISIICVHTKAIYPNTTSI